MTTNDRIDVEALIKCVIKTADNISQSDMKKIMFTIRSPIMNNSQIVTQLTHQYRIAVCMDKGKNIIHFFDIGIVRILFKDNVSHVYSLTSDPKTRMDAQLQETNANLNILTYIFNNYHTVY